jgi:hypothetical protein
MFQKFVPAVSILCMSIFAVAILIYNVEILYALEGQNFSDEPSFALAIMYEIVDQLDTSGFNERIAAIRSIWTNWIGL